MQGLGASIVSSSSLAVSSNPMACLFLGSMTVSGDALSLMAALIWWCLCFLCRMTPALAVARGKVGEGAAFGSTGRSWSRR